MNIEEIKKEWELSFQKTVKEIDNLVKPNLKDSIETCSFKLLARWLIENGNQYYEHLPNYYENFISDPFKTQQFMHQLHNAIVDDGEVSFVNMYQEDKVIRVFMIFKWDDDESFLKMCQDENQIMIDSIIRARTSISNFFHTLQEKYPEKKIFQKPLLDIKSFTFESHGNPEQFMKDCEIFHKNKVKTAEEQKNKLQEINKSKKLKP